MGERAVREQVRCGKWRSGGAQQRGMVPDAMGGQGWTESVPDISYSVGVFQQAYAGHYRVPQDGPKRDNDTRLGAVGVHGMRVRVHRANCGWWDIGSWHRARRAGKLRSGAKLWCVHQCC